MVSGLIVKWKGSESYRGQTASSIEVNSQKIDSMGKESTDMMMEEFILEDGVRAFNMERVS